MRFSSSEMSLSERGGAYRQALKSTFSYLNTSVNVEVDVGPPECFAASIEQMRIGSLRPNWHRSNAAQHIIHVGANRSTTIELFWVSEGAISLANKHGTAHLQAGEMLLWSPAEEWQASHGSFELIAIGLPDAIIRRRAPWLMTMIGRPIAGTSALAACLTALLRQASQCHQRLTAEEGAILETTLVEAICFLSQAGQSGLRSPSPTPYAERLDALKALALDSLERADLSATTLAREVGLSARTIHRLFAASGGSFQSWLQERRLERCWAELATDRGSHQRTVADIAFGSGFNDLSTFNRAFRRRFGVTPRAVRRKSPVD